MRNYLNPGCYECRATAEGLRQSGIYVPLLASADVTLVASQFDGAMVCPPCEARREADAIADQVERELASE